MKERVIEIYFLFQKVHKGGYATHRKTQFFCSTIGTFFTRCVFWDYANKTKIGRKIFFV